MQTHDSEAVQLLKLIEEALSKRHSFDETERVQTRLADLLLTITDDDLYDSGVTFRRWLDDWDIRQRDSEYAAATTRTLKERYLAMLSRTQV